MAIWQLCANLLIPNYLRSNLSYSPLAALELNVIINKKKALDNIRKELQKIGCKKQIYYLDFENDNIDKNVLCLNKELRYRNFSDLCKIIANDSIDSEHINKVEVQNTFNLILK